MARKKGIVAGVADTPGSSSGGEQFDDPSQNPSSPYYVHPNENPSMVLVYPVLDGKNYYEGARSMRMALATKNKSRFIDGSITKPESFDPLFPCWERCNNLLLSWIQRAISPSIARSVIWMDSAFEVWEDLRERFSQGDLVRVFELQQQISQLMQGAMSVTDYFTNLRVFWEELDSYRPFRGCTCAIQCSCQSMRDMKAYRAEDHILKFLQGLDEQYSAVRSQILLLD